MVKTTNPQTGEVLPTDVPSTSDEQTRVVFEKARAAQKEWKSLSFSKRAAHCNKVAAYLAENAEIGSKIVSETNGKTLTDALQTEILPCVMAAKWYASNTERLLKKKKIPCGHFMMGNKANTIEHLPVGVVGIVSPWNYPFAIPFGEIIMGLMAGNAVVLKVATQSVLVGEFIEKCIAAGGFPTGLFAHVVLSGSKCSKLFLENKVDKIFFTGSVPVGKQLMKEASESLTPLSLELGGNDPAIVLPDADIERATSGILWAGFQNAGQSCGGVERVYVHESIFDKFVALASAKTAALKHGPSGDIGSMSTAGQLKIVKDHLADALQKGGKILAQSSKTDDLNENGLWHPATLLEVTSHEPVTMMDETFGPLIPIMKYSTIEEAINLANDSDLALTSSVWTEDHHLAVNICSKLETGITTINDHLYTHGCAETPWGGWKLSGLGRTHGEIGLHEMTNAKAMNYDILPSRLIPRDIWWFPSKPNYQGMLSVLSFLYPKSPVQFVKGLVGTLIFAIPKMFTPWKVSSDLQKGNGFWLVFFLLSNTMKLSFVVFALRWLIVNRNTILEMISVSSA
eukprot:TRINITY_DN772_c2_g1_i1.p1 TRINITY_DN772_c2_g1~~TRINITY_DN772_c2_g1_i1.p1  ORF type:complete len:585 (+),score=132.62 TRINITY_DN772_c2_g1_i1:47-1756(+)